MALVYLNEAGNPEVECGTSYFDITITGTAGVVPYIPNLPETSGIPIAGIRLPSGTTKIMWENIYDVRPWIVGDGFIPTGSYGHIIEEDGVQLPHRPTLNFVGDGFELWDTGGKTTVSGTAASTTFPQERIPYADTDMSLTSNAALKTHLTSNADRGITLGDSAGDVDDYWELYRLNIVNNDEGMYSMGIFGYDDIGPYIESFHSKGLEASPTGTYAGNSVFVWDFYGYRVGTGFVSIANLEIEALEDVNTYKSSKWTFKAGVTGTSVQNNILELTGRQADFDGNVAIPSGSASIPDPSFYLGQSDINGSWRITRSGDDLVMQRLESGVWTTKSTISA
jgi:hypothetical protein